MSVITCCFCFQLFYFGFTTCPDVSQTKYVFNKTTATFWDRFSQFVFESMPAISVDKDITKRVRKSIGAYFAVFLRSEDMRSREMRFRFAKIMFVSKPNHIEIDTKNPNIFQATVVAHSNVANELYSTVVLHETSLVSALAPDRLQAIN